MSILNEMNALGDVYVGIIRTIDSDNNVEVSALMGNGAKPCKIVSVGGAHYQPKIGDRGLVLAEGGGFGSFIPFVVSTNSRAVADGVNLKPGDIALRGTQGGVLVTAGGDCSISSAKSKVNILKNKVSVRSQSVTMSSGGLSVTGGSDGNETSFSIGAADPKGNRYYSLSGGNVSSRVAWNPDYDDAYYELDREYRVSNHFQNTIYAQKPISNSMLKEYHGSPSQGGTNATHFYEKIINQDGSYDAISEYSIGGVGESEKASLTSGAVYTETQGHVGYGEVSESKTDSIHGPATSIKNTNNYARTNEDVRDLGAVSILNPSVANPISFKKSSREDIGNVKVIESTQTEKLHYFIANKLMGSGAEDWKSLYDSYDEKKGKYSCSKTLTSDNGVSINTSVEIWFDDTMKVVSTIPKKLRNSVEGRCIKKAIVKWNTFGMSNEPQELKFPFVNREHDNADVEEGETIASANRSGYLKIEWGKGKDDNWLYRASGVSNRNSINEDGMPVTVTRHIVRPDEMFSIHDDNLKIHVANLKKYEDAFIAAIRPDLKGQYNNKGLDAYGKLKEIVKYSHYITQVKAKGTSVETLRVVNQIGTIDMFQEEEHAPKASGYGDTFKYDLENWKYRNEKLTPNNGRFNTGVYGDFKETKVGTVSMNHLAKQLHNMRATITTIGQYFTNMILPEKSTERHYWNTSDLSFFMPYAYGLRVVQASPCETLEMTPLTGSPPVKLTEVVNSELRGGLSRRVVMEREYTGTPAVEKTRNKIRVASGVDEQSAICAATVLSVAMSKMYGDPSLFFSYFPGNNFFPGKVTVTPGMPLDSLGMPYIPGAGELVISDDSLSPKTILLDEVNKNLFTTDNIKDPRYGDWTAVGGELDNVVSKALQLIDDPMDEKAKFDKAITDCFPGMNDDQSTTIMPNIGHMIKVMKLLTFKNINKREVTDIAGGEGLVVPNYEGLEKLLNELFTEE